MSFFKGLDKDSPLFGGRAKCVLLKGSCCTYQLTVWVTDNVED